MEEYQIIKLRLLAAVAVDVPFLRLFKIIRYRIDCKFQLTASAINLTYSIGLSSIL